MLAGISSYTYTWAIGVPGSIPPKPMNEIELLNKAEGLGVKLVQIADNLPLHLFTEERLGNLIEHAGRKGISVELGAKGLTPQKLEDYILLAERCNSAILRFVIDEDTYRPALAEVIAAIRNAIRELERRSIVLAIENHDRLKAIEFATIIEKCNSGHVGICLDSVNSLGAGEDVMRVTEVLAPFTVNFHVKEFAIKRAGHKMGFSVEGSPLGKGMLPLEQILGMLDQEKCRSAILEQWAPPLSTIEETIEREDQWAMESIGVLQEKLKI